MKFKKTKERAFVYDKPSHRFRIILAGNQAQELQALKERLSATYEIELIELPDLIHTAKKEYGFVIIVGYSAIDYLAEAKEIPRYLLPFVFYGRPLTVEERISARSLGIISFVSPSPGEEELLVAMENVLLYSSESSYRPGRDSLFQKEVTTALNQLLSVQPAFGVQDLCAQLKLSHSTLYRKTKQAFNQTPNRLIAAYRSQKAAILLYERELNITEIAYACGFSSATYFIRTFKQFYGSTPGQFRKNGLSAVEFVRIIE